MNDDTEARQRAPGRTINVRVGGDTADEIELAALDAARAFFGDDRQLEVVRDYGVISTVPGGPCADKKYYAPAGIEVRTVES